MRPMSMPVSLFAGLILTLASGSSLTLVAQGGPQSLPGQASQRAEAQFEGELEVHFEDRATSARLLHFLNVGAQQLRLEFAGPPPDLPTGTRVRARGRLENGTLSLSAESQSLQVLALANANTFGEQRTIVILVNFQDNPSTPYTWASAHTVTFGATSDFFRENSYGQTFLTGDVFGWFTIPTTSTTCDTSKIATMAEQAAAAAGANLASYSRRIYAFPNTSACSFWGRGSVGGLPSRSWINGSYALKVVAHELGHNFGDYHSRSQPCDANGCSTVEYGDSHDVMGNPSSGHLNAFQKERLGWLNYGSSPSIRNVTGSGSYTLDPYEFADGPNPKALRILKSIDSYGRRTWYYIEQRVRLGFDGSITPGILVHTGSEASGNSSDLIDMQPSTATFDAVLDVGQTFSDPAAGLWITTVLADAIGAVVDVNYAGAPCVTGTPTVSVTPSSPLWTQPGVPVSYGVRVTNNDGAGCDSTTFALESAVPGGWSGSYGAASLTLGPGATGSPTLTLVPPSGAAGQYGFVATASRPSASGPSASDSGTVIVASDLVVGLTISGGSNANSYQLSATVRAGSFDVANADVSFTVRFPNGSQKTLTARTDSGGVATAALRLKPKDPGGTYQVQVTASSQGATGTAAGSFVK